MNIFIVNVAGKKILFVSVYESMTNKAKYITWWEKILEQISSF